MKRNLLVAISILLTTWSLHSQNISTPPNGDNQHCIVTQYMGSLVHVTVDYHSPDVTAPSGEDRTGKIWGQLVPYGLTDLGFGLRNPSPWRAGANENTTIMFSHDVEVEGHKIAAGKYGLHLIVRETGPWTWIFSSNSTAWGSFFYDESDDVLRVDVQPSESNYHEWLTYAFTDRQPASCQLALLWENKMVPMNISVPEMNDLYIKTWKDELTGNAGFYYQNWVAASAALTATHENLDQALEWADAAITQPFVGVTNWNTLQNKAAVLTAQGKDDEAMSVMDEALKLPETTAFQIHQYGRQLVAQGKTESALKVFEYNYSRYEGAWPTAVGMARGLSAMGRYEEAIPYAETAVEQSPDDLNKVSMQQAVEKLKAKKDIN